MPLQAPPPSQKFHGWTLAWALGLTQMVSWGVMYYGFGVMLPRMTAEMGDKPLVLATGGFAELVAGIATRIDRVDPHLTLKGLRAVFLKNRKGAA